MVALDDLRTTGDERRDAARNALRAITGYARIAVWSVGWLIARTVALLLTLIAGVFFAIGWTLHRVVPVLVWARTAFVLGWEAGRPRGGGRVAP